MLASKRSVATTVNSVWTSKLKIFVGILKKVSFRKKSMLYFIKNDVNWKGKKMLVSFKGKFPAVFIFLNVVTNLRLVFSIGADRRMK